MIEAKTFLKQLEKLDKLIENKLNEKEQWKSIAKGITASGGQARISAIETETDEHIDNLIAIKRDVIAVIEQLNAVEYDLIHKVYVQHITLNEVAVMNDKSIGWAKSIHKKGLKCVQVILDEREVSKKSENDQY